MSRELHIGFFLPSLQIGGAERVTVNLAREAVRRGIRADIVLATRELPRDISTPPEVRVLPCGASSVLGAIPRLGGYLRSESPDVLISVMDHCNVAAALSKRLLNIKSTLVVSVHNTISSTSAHPNNAWDRVIPLLVRGSYRWADAIVAVSAGVARDLALTTRIPSSRIQVIHNAIVTKELIEMSRWPAAHPWFAPGEGPVILAAGRLVPQKDFVTLVQAFAMVRRSINCRLVILGEGPERENIVRAATVLGLDAEVSLPGYVDNPYAMMSRASVFALTSKWEGLPTVLVEALACGTPVVSTDCPNGPAEVLEYGQIGTLVAVGDVSNLAASLRATIEHPPEKTRLVERGLAFAADRTLDHYLALSPQANS